MKERFSFTEKNAWRGTAATFALVAALLGFKGLSDYIEYDSYATSSIPNAVENGQIYKSKGDTEALSSLVCVAGALISLRISSKLK